MTSLPTTIPALLQLRRNVNAALSALRRAERKGTKPTATITRRRRLGARRKAKPQTPEQEAYDALLGLPEWQNCWACGRSVADWPEWWGAAFHLVRAHVVSRPRVEIPEVVVCLCDSCHYLDHNQKLAGSGLPPLTKAHLLYLRIEHGADLEILRRYNGQALPEPLVLPPEYTASRLRFLGRLSA